MTAVAIAGGGLAGLVAARRLSNRGAEVTLFEREPEIGGRVRSRHPDGFVFDRGFQVLFPAYPAVRTELDLDALALQPFTPGATIARPGHRSTLADPFRDPGSLAASALNPDVTVGDKIRVVRLRRELSKRPPSACFQGPTESIREYLQRKGFSERFIETFAAPFYGGITLDRSLDTDAGVFRYTFKMLTEGPAAVPADGMGAITRQLAESAREAGVTIETNSPVTHVEVDGRASPDSGTAGDTGDSRGATIEADGETIGTDAVVIGTDPPSARDLTGVESIPTAAKSCVTQYVSVRAHRALDTGRKLILNAGGETPSHVAPLSAVADGYAPADEQLLAATTLGQPELDDGELAERTREALASWYPEHRFDQFELHHTERIEFAQFAQPAGFRDGLPDVDAPDGPVFLAGDYTQWSSIQGALESGRVAAEAVAAELD